MENMTNSSQTAEAKTLQAAYDKMCSLYRVLNRTYADGQSRSKVRKAQDQYYAAEDAYKALLTSTGLEEPDTEW